MAEIFSFVGHFAARIPDKEVAAIGVDIIVPEGASVTPLVPKKHMDGKALCLACNHEWIAVAPVGVNAPLECPACHANKGVFKNFVVYSKSPTWHCTECNGFLFTLLNLENTPTIACATCGDLRNALDLFPS